MSPPLGQKRGVFTMRRVASALNARTASTLFSSSIACSLLFLAARTSSLSFFLAANANLHPSSTCSAMTFCLAERSSVTDFTIWGRLISGISTRAVARSRELMLFIVSLLLRIFSARSSAVIKDNSTVALSTILMPLSLRQSAMRVLRLSSIWSMKPSTFLFCAMISASASVLMLACLTNMRRANVEVMSRLPCSVGNSELRRRRILSAGTPVKMTLPRRSKPRRPDRPAICLNTIEFRKTLSPANTEVRVGMLIPIDSVSVEITTDNLFIRNKRSTACL
mmetsp:Transcript_89660/g.131236  ORF Transcript_89660/g.131236 Transcript_89660/m.131236 type:complete len:280 (+) Transcript_89660:164-1003(+)